MDDDFSYHLDAARFNQRAAQKAKESKQQADKKKQPQPPEKHEDKDL